MTKRRLDRLGEDEVVFLTPHTCGIHKKGKPLFKVDPETGQRTREIDNEMLEFVRRFLAGEDFEGCTIVAMEEVFERKVLVPRYYDSRWTAGFRRLLQDMGVGSISLGELEDERVISVGGGHGSPGSDQRKGVVPYIKVSDIRALRVNVNPTNLVPRKVAERLWRGGSSGLRAWDLITPNRASSNIGEFAILLPGEEEIVLTKEVFVIRVEGEGNVGWDPFYLLWAFCLRSVRDQWRRVTLMQTNREDVGNRYREISIPKPPTREWARRVSKPFRDYFVTLAEAKEAFVKAIEESGYEFIANVVPPSLGIASDERGEGAED